MYQNKPFLKGELMSGFNLTSIGTTPQDEKNIQLDGLDGDSSYIPRADTFAKGMFKESLRKRKDQKKRSSWQQLLILINQLQKSIEADFQEIFDILDEMRKICEDALEIIDNLNHQIDGIRLDHEFVKNILDQSGSQGLGKEAQNKHVIALLNRYTERTGKAVSKDDNLRIILMAQIAFEQSVKLPELQHKIEKAGILYDEGMHAIEDISNQRNRLHHANQALRGKPEDETILIELEGLQKETGDLKTHAKSKLADLKYRLDQIEYGNIVEPDNNNFDNQDKLQDKASLDISSIGIKNTIPIPLGK